ncbi:MAG: translation initiation factor IF-1A [Nitrospiraceae bacterium]|nr:translation initiation factor IF-1A [Nitrospiraceae bacterium]
MAYRKNNSNKKKGTTNVNAPLKVPLPRGNQTIGVLETRLGASKSRVRCLDGKTRICRIPGRLKKSLWVRPNDYLIIEPWEYGGDKKGDVVYKYRGAQVNWLKRHNYLKVLDAKDEF